uniref:receptor-type tyrosine-protein phosphatase beta-like isoform X6 n=1 Tax=Scatophagus argus TaxID=75038 RepID=UPI001ED842ED|nr:receptor-type tyrosine-protein phosphatase beta-like isoform X6 [Scatophagus argus]
MKPLLRFGVSLRSLLLFSALLEISQAQCFNTTCNFSETETLTVTTTTVTFGSSQNCTLSTASLLTSDTAKLITGLTPGTVNQISFSCLNCCKEVTMRPEVVKDLKVTGVTTTSLFLTWKKPDGNSSSFIVRWTGGADNTSEISKNITGLNPGVKYTITVAAVADDNRTEGANVTVSRYTKPEAVRNLTASDITTSSVFLSWTEPEGQSSLYRVQWTDGNVSGTENVTETHLNITNLTAGVQYEINVTAVAADGITEGQGTTVSKYTKPEAVRNLSVIEITTSSVFLNWTEPEGQSSFYRVQWTDGNFSGTANMTETHLNIINLTAGVQYEINVTAVAADRITEGQGTTVSKYTKPEVVRNLTASDITTSSVFLSWTEPEGQSSLYRVQWTDGNVSQAVNVTETHLNIINLTAGVQYEINVTAVAADGITEGQSTAVTQYTKPEAVRNLSVTEITTSSVFLNWTEPEGQSSFYRVQWTDGNVSQTANVTETHLNIINLTAGVQYEINVTAVAADGITEGQGTTVSKYTKPEVVRNLTASDITTSSVFLTWTEPEGQSSFYRVQWTDGNFSGTAKVNETHLNITNLTAGVQYEINVTAVAADGITEGQSTAVTQYTKPEAVRNLSVTEITTSSVFLNWTEPEGQSSLYRVQWTDGNVSQTANVTETHLNIINLTAGVQYEINVTAVAADGITEGQGTTVSKYTKPEVVRNLTASDITTSSVFLNWTEPEGQSSFYRVQWTDGNFSGTAKVNETHLNITNLTAGVQYEINVTAVAADGITEGQSTAVTQYTKPEAVRNLSVTEITTSSVFLNWTEPEGQSSFYRVQWTDGNVSQTANVTETHLNIINLTAGVQYEINVTAVAADGITEGQGTTVSKYTKPEVVRNLTASDITTSSVFLNWTEPEGQSSFYRVQWTDGNFSGTAKVNETHLNITNLTAGVQYEINVTAVAADGITEGQSTAVTQYTKPEAVRNLSVTEITTSSVFLNWTEPEGQSSFYRVQWTDGNVSQTANVTETHLNIINLTAGVQYEINVTAVAADGITEGQGTTVSKYTKPEVVRNLTASDITTSSVFLNWTEPEGQSSFYRVQWTDGNFSGTAKVNETHLNITNLTAGVQYEINVTAVAADGITEGQSTAVTQYTKPEAVRNLSVTEITTSSVFLNWTEPEGQSSFYRVQWTDGNVSQTANVTETHLNIINLTAGVQYEINVTAVAADGITEGQGTTVSKYTKPEVVRNLTASDITTSSVFLNWTEPEGQSSFYRVQWTDGNVSQTAKVTETHLNITNLTAAVQYEINVAAVAADRITEGQGTTVSKYTKPEVVRNLTASDITTSSVFLNWTEPEGQSSLYRVQWTDGNVSQTAKVTETHLNIINLTAGVQYEINVTAVAADRITEGQGTTVSKYTKPGKIGQHTVSVNTSSISVSWVSPPGEVFQYRVEWQPGDATTFILANRTFATLSNLIPGTTYTIRVIAVARDGQTGEPYTFTSFTQPAVVKNLTITHVTTSSVSLNWDKPNGIAAFYVVKWTVGEHSLNNTTNETSFTIQDLTPGTQYSITVVAGILSSKGESTSVTTFTKPVKPEGIMVTARGTDFLNISWTLPLGRSEHLVLKISNDDLKYSDNTTTPSTVTTARFAGLNPGRIFVITVTAVAGDFSNTSNQFAFATSPTPPGSIIISHKTNSSLHLRWPTPALMEGAPNISYHITYQEKDGEVLSSYAMVNNTELSSLQSGTSYNITLKTIGPQNLTSTVVRSSAFTRPNPVLNLTASPKSTTSVLVGWSYPQGAQPYYKYLVQTYSAVGAVSNTTVTINSTDVPQLEPGTNYTITVTTIAATESESTEEQTFSYTMPKAVTDLTVQEVNTTSIRLTWLRQSDHKSSYSYLVIVRLDMTVQKYSTENETYTFSLLTPGVLYTFDVFTVVGGVMSAVNSTSSYTKPAAVSDITVVGTTTNLSVSWSPATGQVVSYTVLLYRDSQLEGNGSDLSNNTLKTLFVGRKPGVLYCVVVVTKSGPLESKSSRICNATFPNPPGPITVESQTVKSINFTWPFPQNMDQHQSNFSVASFPGFNLIENNWFLLDNLQSGSPYNISVVTVGVFNYQSTAVTTENYTRPHPVSMLRGAEITTNAVTLVWEQRERKPHYSFVVQASNGSIFHSSTVSNTTYTITGLVAGSNYSFTVTTQTADGTQAAPVTESYFTQPETVQPNISSQGSNNSILVSWTKPPGKVEYYQVRLNSSSRPEEQVVNTNNTHWQFESLSAGRLYSARVITYSGPVNASSKVVTNATFPNPPGLIEILAKTNHSINIRWMEAPLMTGASFQYRLDITSPQRGVYISGTNTQHTFDSLFSGTSYNISVATVGALSFESKDVQIHMVTTKPFSVKSLRASAEEESIMVTWTNPDEYKESYRYRVTWDGSDGNEFTTQETKHNINRLVPGTRYNVKVTTETSDGTRSDTEQISICTNASPVKGLHCEGPNTTNAELILSWGSPNGQHSGFQVTLNNSSSRSTCCNHTVSNLHHNTVYNLTVETLSCGQHSIPVSHLCRTGITNPPIPKDYESMVIVSKKEHNKFFIQIDSRLLDNSNGPITHVGVLVTNNLPADISNWREYLGKNYEQWKAKKTPVYLATVRETISQSRSTENPLSIEIGNGVKWKGYTNGVLDASGKYLYAVVMFTNLSLQGDFVNGEISLVSRTGFDLAVELTRDPAVTAIAVGATLGIFCFLFIVLIGFIIYWRRLSNKESSDIQIHSLRAKVSVAVRTEDYEAYYKKQKADSNCGFAEEFEDLKLVGTGQSKTSALTLDNKPKNRYNNVLPYDSSRVKLSIIHGSPYDDYINANYIPGYNSRKEFIAAQGPLPVTVSEFWRMVWEKNVQTLVMLTRCNEQGRIKCEQYWDLGTKHFENITVTTTSEIPLEDWTIRDFDIKNVKTAETRSVRHFHFTAWPDHGVPETTELLISFRHLVREHMDQYSRNSPTVVHCSAGVGRTGTFIAIDRLIFQIERENIVDVYGIVYDLRMHRPLMVQTEDQYVFLNQCAMDIIRARTGTNVDLIYQNTAALSIYENVEPKKGFPKNGYHNA